MGQIMTVQISNPNPTFFDKDTNLPLAGGYVYFYVANSTTPATTYSDAGLSVQNTSPYIELNSAGNFTNPVFLAAGTYKMKVYSAGGIATGILQWTRDYYDVVSVASFSASQTTNAQTGTTYTIQTTDRSKKTVHSNINSVAVTLPQADSSNFPDGWFTTYTNEGAGIVTITPATSTINGDTTVVLTRGQSALINSDGTNYHADLMGVPVGAENSWGNATPPYGYLICNNNTIGSAASGATKAHAKYRALYTHLWDAYSDSYVAVTTGRGASGNADFDANKTMTMATMANMSLYGIGTLAAGQTSGATTVASTGSISINAVTLGTTNIPVTSPTLKVNSGLGNTGLTANVSIANNAGGGANMGQSTAADSSPTLVNSFGSGTAFTPTGAFTGSASSVLHPVRGKYYIIKY